MLDELAAHKGATTLKLRRALAAKAYARTASYDSAIATWFAQQQGDTFPERLTHRRRARADPALRREPASEGGVLFRRQQAAGRRHGAHGPGQGALATTTSTTPMRPTNAWPSSTSRPSSWSSTPTRAAWRSARTSTRPISRPTSAIRCRSTAASSRVNRTLEADDRDRPRQALPRSRDRARRDARGARDPGAAQGRARAAGRHAARSGERRHDAEERGRRLSLPEPRQRPRDQGRPQGRDQARADRAGTRRSAVRLHRLQAREVERHRLCQGRRHGGRRRGPDEPPRLLADRRHARRRSRARSPSGRRARRSAASWRRTPSSPSPTACWPRPKRAPPR